MLLLATERFIRLPLFEARNKDVGLQTIRKLSVKQKNRSVRTLEKKHHAFLELLLKNA